MKHTVKELLKKYEDSLYKDFDKTKEKDAEEIYFYFEKFNSQIQKVMFDAYCKEKSEYSYYLNNLFHEVNRLGGNALNNLRNYYWYKKNKKEQANVIRERFLIAFSQFILLLVSEEVFYEMVYLKEWEN